MVAHLGRSQHLNITHDPNITLLRSAVIAPVTEEVKFRLGLHYPLGWLFVHGLVQIIPRSTVVAAYAFLIPLSDRLLAHLIGHMPPMLSSVILRARGLYAKRLFPICVYASALTFARAHLGNYAHHSTFPNWFKPLAVAPHFLFGMIFTWVRIRHGLGAAIVTHTMHNLIFDSLLVRVALTLLWVVFSMWF